MEFMKQHVLYILSLISLPIVTVAQTDNDFWFVAPEVTSTHADRPVFLRLSTGAAAATVTIEQPANAASFNGGSPIVLSIAANTTYSQDLSVWIDMIENGSPAANVVENKGLHITSTQNINVYYEVVGTATGRVLNSDLFVLKGANALGTKFYTPFQDILQNGKVDWSLAGNSAIDVVATEDNTTITITPTKNIVGHAAGIPFSIVLNKGQTYSAMATGTLGVDHLGGTLISSNKPIAVTIKDDSVLQGDGLDLIGDQMVPVSIAGTNYIVNKGFLSAPDVNTGDRAVICATENNTTIKIGGVLKTTINAGQIYNYQVTLASEYIETSHPAYVLHVSGFGNEVGGALLPPIVCTGSRTVSITRVTTADFYLNILVLNGGQNNFTITNSATGI
ncbi:MAG: IgGFc-binding protein, partial [Bacteroidetes bacterium]|nr:IgGFc-binding protein [Bacteroidota bacterium]